MVSMEWSESKVFDILAPCHPQEESFCPWKSISLKETNFSLKIIIFLERKIKFFVMKRVKSFNILARQLPLKEELFLFLFFSFLSSESHIETEIALTTPQNWSDNQNFLCHNLCLNFSRIRHKIMWWLLQDVTERGQRNSLIQLEDLALSIRNWKIYYV